MGYAAQQAVAVRSHIIAKRARKFDRSYKSPVERLSEKILQHESLAEFQYFTDIEESENADGGTEAAAVKFYGPDILYGKVHSNDDIWIQQAGGGSNEGWPTFYEMVTTAKRLRKYPSGEPIIESGAPIDDIFVGGFEEEVPEIIFTPTMDDIRANGNDLMGEDKDMAFVVISGSGYSGLSGKIELQGVKDFDVMSWFPLDAAQAEMIIDAGGNWFEDSDLIWTNHIPIYDTVWSTLGGSVVDGSIICPGKLYIYGEISGLQTWGATDTIYIVDDLYYSNTTKGDYPDGYIGIDDDGNPIYDPSQVNHSDFFGLVSEEKILVAYKYRNPDTGEMMDGNVDDQGVYMYGAFAAIGKGDEEIYGEMACHHDGIFTFQYHHPHGSTPNFEAPSPYNGQDTVYQYVDLQRYIFPKDTFAPPELDGFQMHGNGPGGMYPELMCGYPWDGSTQPSYYAVSFPNNGPNYVPPDGTDYPWYNPVWPESASDIVTYTAGREIAIFGAIAQRRRGFIHRSGTDPYNHPNQQEWDLDEFHYDGTHPGTGYDKAYFYDQRFLFIQPPDFPQIYRGWGQNDITSFSSQTWYFKTVDD